MKEINLHRRLFIETRTSIVLSIIVFILLSLDALSQPPSLTELCERHKTDKCADEHNFIEFYERIFEPQRNNIERFFEIGILHGSSHMMWRDYFPNAAIFGIDLNDYSTLLAGENIQTFIADQSNRDNLQAFIEKYGSDFNVILDDGGHAMDHQQVSLGFLFKHLRPGGFFIIEDVHTSLPEFYPIEYYGVNESHSNTTLLMIENYVRTSRLESEYMSAEEIEYLQLNINTVELYYRTNEKHSVMCIIQKKAEEVLPALAE